MSNVDELVEEVARAMCFAGGSVCKAHCGKRCSKNKDVLMVQFGDWSKAAIKAVLMGIRGSNPTMNVAVLNAMNNPTIETPNVSAWDWSVAHRAAIDALLAELEDK